MSIRAMTSVWEKSHHSGAKLLLMLAIADNANDSGYAWPGIATLARKTRLSPRTVQRALKEIEMDGDELAIKWGGSGPKSTNKYYILLGRSDDEITAIRRHVSENGKVSESRGADSGPHVSETDAIKESRRSIPQKKDDKLSPLVVRNKGDKIGLRVTKTALRATSTTVKGDIAVSPEPSLTVINHHQNGNISRVAISLYPSPCLILVGGDGDGYLDCVLDAMDINGKKRREIITLKPRPDFVLAHALYAAARGKGTGWVITEVLAQAVPQSDFITFARLSPDEWSTLWRCAGRGEWNTLQPQLQQISGAWMRAFDGVFDFAREIFLEDAPQSQPCPPTPAREIIDPPPTREMSEHERIWVDASDLLKMQLTSSQFDNWFKDSSVVNGSCNGNLVVAVRDERAAEWITARMMKIVSRAVAEAAGKEMMVEFHGQK